MLDQGKIEIKLKGVQNTLDSIQATALWMMHHRDDAQLIVTEWLSVVRGAKEEQRIALIHLCNEVVQTCQKRHAGQFKDAFRSVLKEAVQHYSGGVSAQKLSHVLSVWRQRSIFDASFVDELSASLGNGTVVPKSGPAPSHKSSSHHKKRSRDREHKHEKRSKKEAAKTDSAHASTNLNADALIKVLKSFTKIEAECASRLAQLDTSRLYVLNAGDLTTQVRDKLAGDVLIKQYAESRNRLADYVAALEAQHTTRVELVSLLRQAEQRIDALSKTMISSERLRKLLRQVDSVKRKLSHSADAPPPPPPPPPPPSENAPKASDGKGRHRLRSNSSDGSVYMDLSDDDAEHQRLVRIASKGSSRPSGSEAQDALAAIQFGLPLDAKAVEDMRKLLQTKDKSRDRDSSRHRHTKEREERRNEPAAPEPGNNGVTADTLLAVPAPPADTYVPGPSAAFAPSQLPAFASVYPAAFGQSYAPQRFGNATFIPNRFGPTLVQPRVASGPFAYARPPTQSYVPAFSNVRVQQPYYHERPPLHSPPKRARSGDDEADERPRRVSNNITLVDTSGSAYSATASSQYQPRFAARVDSSVQRPRYEPAAPYTARFVAAESSGVKLPSFISQSQPPASHSLDSNVALPDVSSEGTQAAMPIASLAAQIRRQSAR